MEEGGFTLVKRGSRACARAAPSAIALARAVDLVGAPNAPLAARDVARVAELVRACAEELRASATLASVCVAAAALDMRPERIVCYGLGSPSASRISRYQLALLLLLLADDPPPPPRAGAPAATPACAAGSANGASSSEQAAAARLRPRSPPASLVAAAQPPLLAAVFDPVLSDADAAIVRALGLAVLPAADVCHEVGALRTLFYMPHCDAPLYEAVVRANGRRGSLRNVWVLGNSFGAYAERSAERRRAQPTPEIDAAVAERRVREAPIADSLSPSGAFNNLSLHAFRDGGEAAGGDGGSSSGERSGARACGAGREAAAADQHRA
ncbi:hypothetical protein KFE25_013196 [Diacronema lutheri]|uniref:SRR1-like domain-containing protein n=2 Tax=Diacronema lutheri TaxID=2081491 RepID=A0A8J5X861_DIALT|nr:hypothetical protein KFE25_013196 [Diacronema lutheri]